MWRIDVVEGSLPMEEKYRQNKALLRSQVQVASLGELNLKWSPVTAVWALNK